MSKATIDYQIFDVDGINDGPELVQESRRREAAHKTAREIEAQRKQFEQQMEMDYLLSSINQNHAEARAKAEEKAGGNCATVPVESEIMCRQVWGQLAGMLGVFLATVAGILIWVL